MISAGSSARVLTGVYCVLGTGDQVTETPGAGDTPVADDHDMFQLRQIGTNIQQLFRARRISDCHPRAAVGEPVAERVGAEQGKQRQGNRSHLVRRNVGDGCFRRLRQQDRDPVASVYPQTAQGVGEAVGQALDVAKAMAFDAAVFMLVDQGERIAGRVPVADVHADVVVFGNPPREGLAQGCIVCGRRKHGVVRPQLFPLGAPGPADRRHCLHY